jgi:hypothetical protein
MKVENNASKKQNLFVNTAAQDLFANAISMEELEPRLELASKAHANYSNLFSTPEDLKEIFVGTEIGYMASASTYEAGTVTH